MALPQQFPIGRGFDHALTYQSYANDYWTYSLRSNRNGYCNNSTLPPYDLWEDQTPAWRFQPPSYCNANNQAEHCIYEDELFTTEAVDYIQQYNSTNPFSLTLSFHSVHTPLTPPTAQLDKFSYINNTIRQKYASMVNLMDQYIGEVVNALKEKEYYNNTFILMFSDNGGPLENGCGANNYPLHGGKHSNYEGGVRVNAFVSGGVIPCQKRGTVETALIGIEDWYATLCGLADPDCDPTDTLAAGSRDPPLPSIDSINQWPLLSGQTDTPPRKEVIVVFIFIIFICNFKFSTVEL